MQSQLLHEIQRQYRHIEKSWGTTGVTKIHFSSVSGGSWQLCTENQIRKNYLKVTQTLVHLLADLAKQYKVSLARPGSSENETYLKCSRANQISFWQGKKHLKSITFFVFFNVLYKVTGYQIFSISSVNIMKVLNVILHFALHQPFHHCTNTCALTHTHTPFPQ